MTTRHFTISDLSLHFPQISRTLLYDIVSSHLGWLTLQVATFYEEDIQKLVPARISASIMVATMWNNSLKNVESDNNKIF